MSTTFTTTTFTYDSKAADRLGNLLRDVRDDKLIGDAMRARSIVESVFDLLDLPAASADHYDLADAIAQAIVVGGIPVGILPTDPEPTPEPTDDDEGCEPGCSLCAAIMAQERALRAQSVPVVPIVIDDRSW